jgi:hypothetical protein
VIVSFVMFVGMLEGHGSLTWASVLEEVLRLVDLVEDMADRSWRCGVVEGKTQRSLGLCLGSCSQAPCVSEAWRSSEFAGRLCIQHTTILTANKVCCGLLADFGAALLPLVGRESYSACISMRVRLLLCLVEMNHAAFVHNYN